MIIQKNNFIIKLAVKATMLYTFSKAGMLPMKLAIYKKGNMHGKAIWWIKQAYAESCFISMLLEFWNNVIYYLA